MERIPEQELMLDEAQALAYARANFEEPHQRVVEAFRETFAAQLDGHLPSITRYWPPLPRPRCARSWRMRVWTSCRCAASATAIC